MKASDFKNIIKEAVREAIREELFEAKSNTLPSPEPLKQESAAFKRTGNSIADMLAETRATMTSDDYRNIMGADSSMAQSFDRSMFMPKQNIKPTSDDPRAVQAAVASAPKVGIDISQLSFVNKAAAIVNAADKKQKEKNGL